MNIKSIQSLSDEHLLRDLESAAVAERTATAHLIALLAEMDTRRLYLQEGFSSLFVYCAACLHLSEHAAYGRIEAARGARKFPLVLDLLSDGSITLTTICLLSNHLTTDNHRQLLEAAKHKSRREVEQQVAALRPRPDVRAVIRRLPQSVGTRTPTEAEGKSVAQSATSALSAGTYAETAPGPVATQSTRTLVHPLAPARYKVQFTIGPETHCKLRQVQDLMRHVTSNGDVATIFDRALTLLLRDIQRTKLASADRPRHMDAVPRGRYIQHQLDAKYGPAMEVSARSLERAADARNVAFSTSTT